jgi:hypothetical protein
MGTFPVSWKRGHTSRIQRADMRSAYYSVSSASTLRLPRGSTAPFVKYYPHLLDWISFMTHTAKPAWGDPVDVHISDNKPSSTAE